MKIALVLALGIVFAMSSAPTLVSAGGGEDALKDFTPGEDPKIPGWDPDRVEEDAPGQLKAELGEGSAAEVSPGHEAQEAGVIGNCDPTEDKDCHRGND